METLHDRFDKIARLSGEREIESRGTSFDRIKVRIAGKLRQAAETLYGKTEDNQTPRGARTLALRPALGSITPPITSSEWSQKNQR